MNINELNIAFSVLLLIAVALNIQLYRWQGKENKKLKIENELLKEQLSKYNDAGTIRRIYETG